MTRYYPCQHPDVTSHATPGSNWRCPDCKAIFYLHPWDKNQLGMLADILGDGGTCATSTQTPGIAGVSTSPIIDVCNGKICLDCDSMGKCKHPPLASKDALEDPNV